MDSASNEFIEQMGLIAQRNGSPRISGRISGLLIVLGKPVTLQDIADTLQVSKASASTNARLLRDRGMLRLTSMPGERQDYYELVPNPFQSMLAMLSRELQQAAKEIGQTIENFSPEQADVVGRIVDLQQFYQGSANFLADITANLTKPNSNSTEGGDAQ